MTGLTGFTGLGGLTRRLDSARPHALGLFRVVVGLLFACHGAASLFGVLGGAMGTHGGTLPAGTWPGWYAAVIQLAAGVFVLLGLATRPAALVASGSMAYAYFDVHQRAALWPIQNGGELSVLFCWAFLLLVFTGHGAFGLDGLLARNSARHSAEHGRPTEQRTPATA